ncbi:hypothetical protein FSP39_004445 [Pinctada imbricata]|uniref:Glucose-methanol-choline oxidoreductase N-terminal domain-containing protein n=1 Tax=Pinctada imbricata TaxID=66713 RepID=A0AA88XQ07_PINIB|nr:hypothetical protein FSP39_004445 [Pinctada imbricata]
MIVYIMCKQYVPEIYEIFEIYTIYVEQEITIRVPMYRRSLLWWLGLGLLAALIAFVYVTGLRPVPALVDKVNATYDFVIVGGGTAGSILASRLSENPDVTVLLLEAGGLDRDPDIKIPLLSTLERKTEYDWMYYTVPQQHAMQSAKEKRGRFIRGRILGGTSMVNNMVYMRGSSKKYDDWEKIGGCKGWGYKDIIPYFLKSEHIDIQHLTTSAYHSKKGSLTISDGSSAVKPLADVFRRATKQIGVKSNDCNGKDFTGHCDHQTTTRDGERVSVTGTFLRPAMERKNLHIGLQSHVTKVLIYNKKAVGVEFLRNGRKEKVGANKEIILTAGAIASPHILLLSGIGPAEHLNQFKIPVHEDLPVGEFLQDHISVPVRASINESYTLTPPRATSVISKIKYKAFGAGPLSSNGAIAGHALLHSNKTSSSDDPDLAFTMFATFPELWNGFDLNYGKQVQKELLPERNGNRNNTEGFTMMIQLLYPKSSGTLRLKSSNPFDHPEVDPNYLAQEDDTQALIRGLKLFYKMMKTQSFRDVQARPPYTPFSQCSKFKMNSDRYFECLIRHLSVSGNNPIGACRMGEGSDVMSVVDSKLRVKGIDRLRVADASVMPSLVSSDNNAPVVMVAEKAADIIKIAHKIQRNNYKQKKNGVKRKSR